MKPHERHTVPCPFPGCEGQLKVSVATPAGEYPCVCHHCTVRLTWAIYQPYRRVPHVVLSQGQDEPTVEEPTP